MSGRPPHMPHRACPIPRYAWPRAGTACTRTIRSTRAALARLDQQGRSQGREEVMAALDPAGPRRSREGAGFRGERPPGRSGGHYAGSRSTQDRCRTPGDPFEFNWAAVLRPSYSFVSITEVSEYVPTVEQYADKLQADGMSVDDPAYGARIKQYEQRLPMMNKQRLYPDFPDDGFQRELLLPDEQDAPSAGELVL